MSIEYIDKTHARITVSFGTGQDRIRRTKSITYNGKRDAQKQEIEFYEKVKNEIDIDSKLTISKLLDWYISRFEKNGGKATTIRAYRSCEKALNSRYARTLACELTTSQLQKFIDSQTKSAKTIKNEISLLSAAYKEAIRRDMLKDNPCANIKLPKYVKNEKRVLTEEELPLFIRALDNSVIDFKVMCELALFCGMRRSEILALRYEDIGDTITIDKVRHHFNKQDHIQTPKTATSNRTLSIPSFILKDMEALRLEQEQRAYDSDYLIQNLWGLPVSGYWADKKMEEFRQANGFEGLTIHGLRHTYASLLINEGVPIAEVSSELGHASIDITLRTYTHMITDSSTASKKIAKMMEEKQKVTENVT